MQSLRVEGYPRRRARGAIVELKAHPGKYTYASPGAGTPQHLAMELFKAHTETSVLHVPYKGSAGAVTDVIGGRIDMMMVPLHFSLPHARSGRVRVLGVASPERVSFAPEVPTFDEQGVKNVDVDAWFGLFAPSGTPSSIITKLSAEVANAMAQPDVLGVLEKQGITPRVKLGDQLEATMRSDFARWGALVKKMGIKAE